MSMSSAIDEICQIEGNDDLHDYGGGHGNKGNDFAKFWLINELLKLSKTGAKDFLFLLEYVQDVAHLDTSTNPTEITLYQLKKRENNTWDLGSLAGLTAKSTKVKADSPLAKLLRSVLSFKELNARGEFVSNAKYKVELCAGESSLALDYLDLNALIEVRQTHIRDSTAETQGVSAADVPLSKITLRHAPIEVNDMRVHIIGVAHGFLKELSAAHAAQADAFVDALFVKLSTPSRNTSKCQTWDELINKRGYSKAQFDEALATLQLLPDQQSQRADLLQQLSQSFGWHSRDTMKVEVALTELARLKLTQGEINFPEVDRNMLVAISSLAENEGWSQEVEFEKIADFFTNALPNDNLPRIRALTIYSMVEAWTNQISA